MKTAFSILILAITLSTNAQVRVKNHSSDPKLVTPRSEPKNDVQSQNNQFAHWGTTSFGGNVAIGFGGGSYYGNSSPYNSYYFNNYSLKKTTRNSIRSAKYMINDAVAFDTWNDIYSPLVANAIRHYNYARQLYSRGNYEAAYNHGSVPDIWPGIACNISGIRVIIMVALISPVLTATPIIPITGMLRKVTMKPVEKRTTV